MSDDRRRARPAKPAPRRSLYPYYGGKFRLAPWIVEQLPPHIGYVEPFCGSAAVLLAKARSQFEVINDLDGGVVAALRACRDHASELADLLALTLYAREEYEDACLAVSTGLPDDVLEAARVFITVVRQGMFSQSRPSKSSWRHKRGPAGRHETTWSRLPEIVWQVSERLHGVAIERRPATQVIQFCDRRDVVFYCDPPYHPGTCDVTGYAHRMTREDHADLATVLRGVEGMVVLSGYHHEDYQTWFGDWHSLEREAVSVSAAGVHAPGGCRRTEVLWFNPQAWDARQRAVEVA